MKQRFQLLKLGFKSSSYACNLVIFKAFVKKCEFVTRKCNVSFSINSRVELFLEVTILVLNFTQPV